MSEKALSKARIYSSQPRKYKILAQQKNKLKIPPNKTKRKKNREDKVFKPKRRFRISFSKKSSVQAVSSLLFQMAKKPGAAVIYNQFWIV